MQSSIEDLFGQLKEISSANQQSKPETSDKISNNNDILQLEDVDQKLNAEEVFKQIEGNLQALPKLSNDFDQLVNSKQEQQQQHHQQEKKPKSESEDWFTLPKPDGEMLAKVQRDLVLLKHRAALDPKRHYKKDRWKVPERFAVGTIVEDKSEFYSSRLTNKQRKSTILETLMNDETSTKYFKKKYTEIQLAKTSGKKKHYNKMKALRRHK